MTEGFNILDVIADPTEKIAYRTIGAAIEVHKILGPGLLESSYEKCLAIEFMERKLQFQQQVSLPIKYKNYDVDCCYRLDFIIENSIILELKSVEKVLPIHESQLITYLKLSGIKLGLIINFNVQLLKNAIQRIIV